MAGKKGMGAKFSYESATPGTFVDIANITKIRPFNLKTDSIDVTAMDSANSYREKLATLLDAGQASVDLNYDDKAATHLFLSANLGVTKNFKMTFPGTSPTVVTFAGFINGLSAEVPHDNKMTSTVMIEITGPLTWA